MQILSMKFRCYRLVRFVTAFALFSSLALAGCGGADSADSGNVSSDTASASSASAGDSSGLGIKSIVVSPSYHKIVGIGQTIQMSANVWFDDGTLRADATDSVDSPDPSATPMPVHWSTDNYGIASVDDAGLVTGVSSGETLIHADVDGHEALARVVVQNVSSLDPNIDPGLPPP